MAGIPDHSLMTEIAASLRHVLARRTPGDDSVRVAILELALGLVEAALPPSVGKTLAQVAKDDAIVEQWSRDCADLLAAISRPLAGLSAVAVGGNIPGTSDALPSAAERFAATTRDTHEALKRLADALRTENVALIRRVGELGALTRSLQREEKQLADDVAKLEAAEKRFAEVAMERGGILKRIHEIYERERLVTTTPEELKAMEARVIKSENEAKARNASRLVELGERLVKSQMPPKEITDLESQVQAYELTARAKQASAVSGLGSGSGRETNSIDSSPGESTGLEERIKQTKRLIAEFESVADFEAILKIERIWMQRPETSTGSDS